MKIWHTKQQYTQKLRERRLDIRKPATINAVVCSEKNSAQPCVISSLSLTGMLLQLEHEFSYDEGSVLQVVFYSVMDNYRKLCCEWVRVAGMRHNGVAVSFDHFDNQHQTNIQLMLHLTNAHTTSTPLTLGANRQGFLTAEHSRKTA